MKSFGYFSNKGGVGRTTAAFYMALNIAKSGKRVCLIDMDLIAPSETFKMAKRFNSSIDNPRKSWINNYLFEDASLEDSILDCSNINKSITLNNGSLFIGFTSSDPRKIEKLVSQFHSDGIDPTHYEVDPAPEMAIKLLKKLKLLKELLSNEPYCVDYLITDNAPGLGLLSLTSMVSMDDSHFIVKFPNQNLLSKLIEGESEIEPLKSRIMDRISKNLSEFKIQEQIELDESEKRMATRASTSEIQSYIEKIFNDEELRELLD